MTIRKKGEGRQKPSLKTIEMCEYNNNLSTSKKLLRFSPKVNNSKRRTRQSTNKYLCPFACPTCQSLGGDLVKSKYEIVNILSDTGDSIFSPMHELYHDEDYYKDHRSLVRNDGGSGGKVFLSVDLVNPIFTNSRNRSFKQIEY